MVVPDASVSALVSMLKVNIEIGDGGSTTVSSIPVNAATLPSTGAAFVLRPKTAPTSAYTLRVTVYGQDSNATVMALGSGATTVLPKGCNHINIQLTALGIFGQQPDLSTAAAGGGGGGDGGGNAGGGGGAGGSDMLMSVQPDLANCIGGTPDEDLDQRADSCDLCPADPEPSGPVDSDADGVPDQCDPNPTTAGNRNIYFEPFNLDVGHWTGGFPIGPVSQSLLDLDATNTNGPLFTGNFVDGLPLNVRLESWIFFEPRQGVNNFDGGIFLGDIGTSPVATPNNGIYCDVQMTPNGRGGSQNMLVVQLDVDGTGTTNQTKPISQDQSLQNQNIRLRLTQTGNGNTYVCEMAVQGTADTVPTVAATVSFTLPAGNPAPVAPQHILLRANNIDVHFHSVVAETALP